jgi:hypothetical protein
MQKAKKSDHIAFKTSKQKVSLRRETRAINVRKEAQLILPQNFSQFLTVQ